MFVRNRKPALSLDIRPTRRKKLKYLFLSAVEEAFRSGELPKRRHGWHLVYQAFIDMMGPDETLYPSHAAIAEKSHTCPRTVWAAMNALEAIGLIRVTPRYVYDADKGKTVRTSNLYEIVVNKAQKAIAIVAASARKNKERAKSSMKKLFHHLPAKNTKDSPKPIYKERNSLTQPPQMSPNEYRAYIERWANGF
ncbi:hypothetical protein GS535_03500 [Saccharibacter sp. EH611]|uniref:hypothetical protein n=1 Tax=unclassified Saccharibacter TaxID=2648722 RepID=UPI00132300B4|nr:MULTISPECIES: hypothetical protein [unclassified Saccharibacter]MXV35622.1 hypothetical protein [Saccharibacter sp. EH611]MXV65766.1 hypothetical protein [Saccharibacter sp. EH60]